VFAYLRVGEGDEQLCTHFSVCYSQGGDGEGQGQAAQQADALAEATQQI